MKKFLCFLLIVAVLVSVTGCIPIRHRQNASGQVVYAVYGVELRDELTEQEVAAVVEILNGKVPEISLLSTPSCGFSSDIAIIIDGTPYALAMDQCGVLQNCITLHYITISDAERAVLEDIFARRGGEFPCI